MILLDKGVYGQVKMRIEEGRKGRMMLLSRGDEVFPDLPGRTCKGSVSLLLILDYQSIVLHYLAQDEHV
jgi:hypothetical protein